MKGTNRQLTFCVFWCIFEVLKGGPTCPRHCTCDYYSSVHTIDCDSQDFYDFPPGIPTWTTSLSFDGNFLNALNLSAFNTTVYFEEFRIRYNEIDQIIIQQDTADATRKKGTCSDIGQLFPRLVDVNLRGNKLSTLPKCLSAIWPVLKILNLSENRFRSLQNLNFVNHFYYYDSLEELYLRRNQISQLTKRDLFSPANALRNLKVLDLSENQILKLDGDVFMFLSELRDLRLQDNQLKSIPDFAFLTTGQTIESILLHQNRIKYISTKAFAGLPLLRRLDIRGNNIQCLTNDTISTCSLQREEQHNNNQVDTSNYSRSLYKAIVDLRSLQQLRVKGNPWFCDCNLLTMFENEELKKIISTNPLKLSCKSPDRFRNYYFPHAMQSLNCTINA